MGTSFPCLDTSNNTKVDDENGKRAKSEAEEKVESKAPQQESKQNDQQFAVRPFAVMRLTHEAIRAGMKDLKNALEQLSENCSNMDECKIIKIFGDLVRCIIIHAKQEDQAFFPLLNDKFDGVIKTEEIPPKHDNDEEQRLKLQSIFENGCDSKNELSLIINEWIESHEQHLKLEEKVMMPLTKKTAVTIEERGKIVRSIINIDRKEFSEYQFEYVLCQLVKTKPFGPVLMYCKATQMSSNTDEYNQVKGKIKEIVGEEMWKKLEDKGCDENGKQP